MLSLGKATPTQTQRQSHIANQLCGWCGVMSFNERRWWWDIDGQGVTKGVRTRACSSTCHGCPPQLFSVDSVVHPRHGDERGPNWNVKSDKPPHFSGVAVVDPAPCPGIAVCVPHKGDDRHEGGVSEDDVVVVPERLLVVVLSLIGTKIDHPWGRDEGTVEKVGDGNDPAVRVGATELTGRGSSQ